MLFDKHHTRGVQTSIDIIGQHLYLRCCALPLAVLRSPPRARRSCAASLAPVLRMLRTVSCSRLLRALDKVRLSSVFFPGVSADYLNLRIVLRSIFAVLLTRISQYSTASSLVYGDQRVERVAGTAVIVRCEYYCLLEHTDRVERHCKATGCVEKRKIGTRAQTARQCHMSRQE